MRKIFGGIKPQHKKKSVLVLFTGLFLGLIIQPLLPTSVYAATTISDIRNDTAEWEEKSPVGSAETTPGWPVTGSTSLTFCKFRAKDTVTVASEKRQYYKECSSYPNGMIGASVSMPGLWYSLPDSKSTKIYKDSDDGTENSGGTATVEWVKENCVAGGSGPGASVTYNCPKYTNVDKNHEDFIILSNICYMSPDEASTTCQLPVNEATQAEIDAELAAAAEAGRSTDVDETCQTTIPDFGWVACPGLDWLSRLIDSIIEGIAGGLKWQANSDNLRQAWTFFLPIANVALAVVFLIVIYSTASGVGLSNYSIKKIMPRLIIVAVAVNVSFYLCIALVDLSNMAGNGIKDLILSAADAAANAAFYQESYLALFGQSVIGGIAIILILLFSWSMVGLALLTILIAIAARQIILILLVMVSPVAVVLYLLPNTKKLFDKWWTTFWQLLIVYPIFMAGWSVVRFIQISGVPANNNIEGGEFLQFLIRSFFPIVPLFMILPLLKMSSGLMGKITGQIEKGVKNNPLSQRLQALNKDVANKNLLTLGSRAGQKKEGARNTDEAKRLEAEKEKKLRAVDNLQGVSDEAKDLERKKIEELYGDKNAGTGLIGDAAIQDAENDAWNRDNKDKIDKADKYNKSLRRRLAGGTVGFASRFATGETTDEITRRADERAKNEREQRNLEKRESMLRQDAQAARGETITDEDGNPVTNPFERARARSAARGGWGELSVQEAAIKKERAEGEFQRTLDMEKASQSERERAGLTGSGALYGTQQSLNTANREKEAAGKAVEADAATQKAIDSATINRVRQSQNIIDTSAARQKTMTNLQDEAEIQTDTEVNARSGTATIKADAQNLQAASDKELENAIDRQKRRGGTLHSTQQIVNAENDIAVQLDNQLKTEATGQRTRRTGEGSAVEIERSALNLKTTEQVQQGRVDAQKVDGGTLRTEQQNVDTSARTAEVAAGGVSLQTEEAKSANTEYLDDMARVGRDTEAAKGLQESRKTETLRTDLSDSSSVHHRNAVRAANIEMEKGRQNTEMEREVTQQKRKGGALHDAQVETEVTEAQKGAQEAFLKADKEQRVTDNVERLGDIDIETRAATSRSTAASNKSRVKFAKAVKQNTVMVDGDNIADYAGGVGISGIGAEGAKVAQATATGDVSAERRKIIDARKVLIEEVAESDIQAGVPRWSNKKTGAVGTFERLADEAIKGSDTDQVEAIVEIMANNGQKGVNELADFWKRNLDNEDFKNLQSDGISLSTTLSAMQAGTLRPQMEGAHPALAMVSDFITKHHGRVPTADEFKEIEEDPNTYTGLKPEQLAGMDADSIEALKRGSKDTFNKILDKILADPALINSKIKNKTMDNWGIEIFEKDDHTIGYRKKTTS